MIEPSTQTWPLLLSASGLELPPVGVNHQYTTDAKSTKLYLTQVARAYRKRVHEELDRRHLLIQWPNEAQMLLNKAQWDWARKAKPELAVQWTFYVSKADIHRRDLDGLIKLPQDVIFKWLGLHDAWIMRYIDPQKIAVPTEREEHLDIAIYTLPARTIEPIIPARKVRGPRPRTPLTAA